ncbi:LysR family transcriptional regulator [Alcaligenaceae bacterium CGII-47]|nr:LysR family transcriptional regulator [Alcaligenaceae bacterium CGII-47]
MHIRDIDLNLLRLFDAVYNARNVSRAAIALDLTQPAVSQGLTRLRNWLGDPLFIRGAGGVTPTPRADRLAGPIHDALHALEGAIFESGSFDPSQSRKVFRLHMTDIGEGRFLPALINAVRQLAPHARIETLPIPGSELEQALDRGRIDLAFGFLPLLANTRRAKLFSDRYIVLMRRGHPFVTQSGHQLIRLYDMQQLDFISVRTHAYTIRTLQALNLEYRIRLTTEHFMALPAIIQATDLAVIMPHNIAQAFPSNDQYAILDAVFPMRDFEVSIHWSQRHDADPSNQWLRHIVLDLYAQGDCRAN